MARDYTRQEVLDIIEREAIESRIPRDDFLRFAYVETGDSFNELAHNKSSNAKGLFQFVPSTANQFDISGREFDPEVNTDAAARLYLQNRRDLMSRHARTDISYLSGAAGPNGLDMYIAHQQGAGGYRSIQSVLATGDFSLASTRRNIFANVSSDDFERLTGHPYADFRAMSDRDVATAFNQYWTAKFNRTRIPEKGIESIPHVQQEHAPIRSLEHNALRNGDRGAAVTRLQQAMNQLGFRDSRNEPLETQSDIYGNRTTESVRSFQQVYGLEPTGVADQRTLIAIQHHLQLPESRNHTPSVTKIQHTGIWPAPENVDINRADKGGEGRGEFGTSRAGGTRTHRGIDIQGDIGDPILAYGAGRIRVQPNNGAAGNTVTIDHGNDVVTRYFHLQDVNIQHGQQIAAGQQIGTMGRTGNTPRQGDTHLHFEMHRHGRAVDPMDYLSALGREQRQSAVQSSTQPQPSSAELIATTLVGLNTDPLRNLDRTMSVILPDGVELAPRRTVNGMPDYLLPGLGKADREGSTPSRAPLESRQQPAAAEAAVPHRRPVSDQLQFGAEGTAVVALQENLRLLGATDAQGRKLDADGDYGPSTRQAVEQFQLWTGLSTTGVADRVTLEELRSHAQFTAQQLTLGVPPGEHLRDNLRPSTPHRDMAADPRLPPGREQTQAAPALPLESALLPYSNPRHPQHDLYADVAQRLGAKNQLGGMSEERMNQIVGALYRKGYEAGFNGDVVVQQNQFYAREVDLSRLGSHVKVEMNQPAPSIAQTMRDSAAHDLHQTQQQARSHQQSQEAHASRM